MSKAKRLAGVLGFIVVVAALVVWGVSTLITPGTPGGAVNFTNTQAKGAPVDLTIQTVGSIGFGSHPTWVTYMVKNPDGQWQHSTVWELPANSTIHVTEEQFDSGSPLRNQVWGQITGTVGGIATVNGTSYSHYDSYTGTGVAHTFVVPALGIAVPFVGVGGTAALCGVAPCQLSSPHNIITFSFKTHGPGSYEWQCFVPCGLDFLYGNGGPMSTEGYMGGFLNVES
ncbi:MAG: hypothetical protein ACRDVC_07750 [Acidimicrobiales bacterium]